MNTGFEIDDEIPFPIAEGRSIHIPIAVRGDAEFDFDGDTWIIDWCEIKTDEPTEKGWDHDWVRIDDLPQHKNIIEAATKYMNKNFDPYEEFGIKRPTPQELYA